MTHAFAYIGSKLPQRLKAEGLHTCSCSHFASQNGLRRHLRWEAFSRTLRGPRGLRPLWKPPPTSWLACSASLSSDRPAPSGYRLRRPSGACLRDVIVRMAYGRLAGSAASRLPTSRPSATSAYRVRSPPRLVRLPSPFGLRLAWSASLRPQGSVDGSLRLGGSLSHAGIWPAAFGG